MLAEGEVKQVGSVRERWLMAVHEKQLVVPPRALTSGNPLRWLRFFGPGAIIASLNLGSGETLFSSRGGAIFGYRILWVFLIVALLKWVLTYSSMRHMILSGAHPFERWSRTPRSARLVPALHVYYCRTFLSALVFLPGGAAWHHLCLDVWIQ